VPKNPEEKILSQVKSENLFDCWEWQGHIVRASGYGRVWYKRSRHYAHRLVYSIYSGLTLRPTDVVMHLCNNPRCCNPSHLKLGSISENNQYTVECGRRRNNFRKRLTTDEILEIRLRLKFGHGISRIANSMNRSESTIRGIRDNKIWKDVQLPEIEKEPFCEKIDPFDYDPFEY